MHFSLFEKSNVCNDWPQAIVFVSYYTALVLINRESTEEIKYRIWTQFSFGCNFTVIGHQKIFFHFK